MIKFWPLLPSVDAAPLYAPILGVGEDFDWSACLLTPPRLEALVRRLLPLSRFVFDDSHNTPEAVLSAFLRPGAIHFEIYEDKQLVGYCALTDMAVAHVTFFDRRSRGREAALNKFLSRVMRAHALPIIRAFVPLAHRTSVAMLKRMGWMKDGYYRRFIKRQGEWEDAVVFSVTAEELANGRLLLSKRTTNQTTNPAQPPGDGADAGVNQVVRPAVQPAPGHAADLRPVPRVRPAPGGAALVPAPGAETDPGTDWQPWNGL